MKARFLLAAAAAMLVPALFTACANHRENERGLVFIESSVTGDNCHGWSVDPTQSALELPTIKTQTFKSVLKKPSGQTFLDVKLTDMWVEWVRIDGGTRVPARFHNVFDVLVPAGGSATLLTAWIMSGDQLTEAPFDALQAQNGGVDLETKNSAIRMKAIVTWYGTTYNGDPIKTTLELNEEFAGTVGCSKQ